MFTWYLSFCLEGSVLRLNEGKKLNSQARVDLCCFHNASWVGNFSFLLQFEEGGFENVAASKLRCESDPSLSVYMYSTWPARVVLVCFFFLCKEWKPANNGKAKAVAKTCHSLQLWWLNQIVKSFKTVTSSHCLKNLFRLKCMRLKALLVITFSEYVFLPCSGQQNPS